MIVQLLDQTRQWLTDDPASRAQARVQGFFRTWQRFKANRRAFVGLLLLAAVLMVACLAPWLAPNPSNLQNLDEVLKPPSAAHWFGTDGLGRDILSRMIYGSRVTMMIVLVTAAIVGPISFLVGCVAGYCRGVIDAVLMRMTDLFLAFPRLIMALAIVATIGSGIENTILAIALTAWPPLARIARAEALVVRNSEYIKWARVLGASAPRIIFGHVLPMCLPSLIIRLALEMGGIVLTVAGLGFLGLGAQPPSPEWGAMLAEGRHYMLQHWWMTVLPGAAILVAAVAFNLLADGLRDVLDPRAN
jgi:peptide/nickel transport system permease protein